MKPFLVPIYVKPLSASGERICVGLAATGTNGLLFYWSEKKLRLGAAYASPEVFKVACAALGNLKADIEAIYKRDKDKLFYSEKYGVGFFNYLKSYSKGFFENPEPVSIPSPLRLEEFKALFELYTGVEPGKGEKEKSRTRNALHKILRSKSLRERADVNYKLTPKIVSTIYTNTEVDIITVNGAILAAEEIDFTGSPDYIKNKLNSFRAITEGLELLGKAKNLGEGNFCAYFNEPSSEGKKILNNALKDSHRPFKLAPIEEAEGLPEKLETGNYRKFSTLIGATEE